MQYLQNSLLDFISGTRIGRDERYDSSRDKQYGQPNRQLRVLLCIGPLLPWWHKEWIAHEHYRKSDTYYDLIRLQKKLRSEINAFKTAVLKN